jgi:hypothetical protein
MIEHSSESFHIYWLGARYPMAEYEGTQIASRHIPPSYRHTWPLRR